MSGARRAALAASLIVVVAAAAASVGACSKSDSAPPGPADAGAGDDGGMRSTGLPQSCVRGARDTSAPDACNGAKELCARTYDKVVVPMTHNAMADSTEGFTLPNQEKSLEQQLDDGVRGMMLDTHYFDPIEQRDLIGHADDLSSVDQAFLCHTSCTFGHTRMLDGLCTITNFLDAHPGEVVSIIFENYVTDADTDALLHASGLVDYAYTHPAIDAPWPTLGELVSSGKRLVVFLEHDGGNPGYLHPAWKNVWDTPYTFNQASEFSCALNRGATTNPLFLVNHWLSPPGHPELAAQVNVTSVLGARVQTCTSAAGRAPTFVGVDYYDEGDLFAVVKTANGL